MNHRKSPTLLNCPINGLEWKHLWLYNRSFSQGVVPICVFSECYVFSSSGSYFLSAGTERGQRPGHERIPLLYIVHYLTTCFITETRTHIQDHLPFQWRCRESLPFFRPISKLIIGRHFYWDHQSRGV